MKADHWSHSGFQQIGTIPNWSKETAKLLGGFVGGLSVGWGGGWCCLLMYANATAFWFSASLWEAKRLLQIQGWGIHPYPSWLSPHRIMLLQFSDWRQKVYLLWGRYLPGENPQLESRLMWELPYCRIPKNYHEFCICLTLSWEPCTQLLKYQGFTALWWEEQSSLPMARVGCCPLPRAGFIWCLGTWFGGWYW